MEDRDLGNNNHNQFIPELFQTCDGLLWLSESEYPWQVIDWEDEHEDELDPQFLLQRYHYHPETRVIVTTLLSFFNPVLTEAAWHGEIEKAETRRYQNLYFLLEQNLSNIKVFLVGEIEVDVYILGKTKNNSIVGLSTKAIET
jgi:hypothetical protein